VRKLGEIPEVGEDVGRTEAFYLLRMVVGRMVVVWPRTRLQLVISVVLWFESLGCTDMENNLIGSNSQLVYLHLML